MKCLIDTHVLLWAIGNSANLSTKSKEILSTATVYVSAVSWWEISIKYAIGKLKLGNKTPHDLWQASEHLQFGTLPIQGSEAYTAHQLDLLTRDPFDRMLVWQAIQNNLVLISKDSRLKYYEKNGLQLIW